MKPSYTEENAAQRRRLVALSTGWTEGDLAKLPSEYAASGHTVSHSTLKAPFSGVVTSFHAVGSEVVEQGTELLSITDMSSPSPRRS